MNTPLISHPLLSTRWSGPLAFQKSPRLMSPTSNSPKFSGELLISPVSPFPHLATATLHPRESKTDTRVSLRSFLILDIQSPPEPGPFYLLCVSGILLAWPRPCALPQLGPHSLSPFAAVRPWFPCLHPCHLYLPSILHPGRWKEGLSKI